MDKKTPCRLTSVLERLQRWLGGRHAIAWILLFTLALTAPSLINGLAGDDYFVRAVVLQNTEIPGVPTSIFDAFPFTKGDPAVIKQGIDAGLYPWWTHPQHQITFFRPLSSLTLWLDFKLFSGSVWLMHVHSILWYALLVFVTGLLYRRFLAPCWVAGLAALLYAIDYSHAVGAASLCNRFAVIAAVFGFIILVGILFVSIGCANCCHKGGKYLVCVDNDGNGVGCYCTNEYIINTNNSTITLFSIEDNVSITLAYDGFSVYSQ